MLPLTSSCITIAHADEILSIQQLPAQAPLIHWYPNLAREQTQVDLGSAQAEQIEVLDMLGQPVRVYQTIQGVHTISREQLPKGMYLVRVYFENGSQSTHKIIFQ